MINVNAITSILGNPAQTAGVASPRSAISVLEQDGTDSFGSLVKDTVNISKDALDAIRADLTKPVQPDDRRPSLEEILRIANKVFDKADTDSNGLVDSTELMNIMFDHSTKLEDPAAIKYFATMTTGFMQAAQGDYKLSKPEMEEHFTRLYNGQPPGVTPTHLDKHDADKPIPTLKEFIESHMKIFNEIDTNHDGVATSSELKEHFLRKSEELGENEALRYISGISNAFIVASGDDMEVTKEEAISFLKKAYHNRYGNGPKHPPVVDILPIDPDTKPHVPTLDQYVGDGMKIFKDIDTNGDGILNKDEMAAFFDRETVGMTDEEANNFIGAFTAAFLEADVNDDIEVTEKEALAWLHKAYAKNFGGPQVAGIEPVHVPVDKPIPTLREYIAQSMELFKDVDSDNNGILTKQEMLDFFERATAGMSEQDANNFIGSYSAAFLTADVNDDVEVTVREAIAFLKDSYHNKYGPDTREIDVTDIRPDDLKLHDVIGPDTDPFFAMLNKNGDEYVTREEFLVWLDSLKPMDDQTKEEFEALKARALEMFDEMTSLVVKYHLNGPNQPPQSATFGQYKMYLAAYGIGNPPPPPVANIEPNPINNTPIADIEPVDRPNGDKWDIPTFEEMMANADRLFDWLDTDKNGEITFAELKDGIKRADANMNNVEALKIAVNSLVAFHKTAGDDQVITRDEIKDAIYVGYHNDIGPEAVRRALDSGASRDQIIDKIRDYVKDHRDHDHDHTRDVTDKSIDPDPTDRPGDKSIVDRFFSIVDKDNDGHVNQREFHAWIDSQKPDGISDRQFSFIASNMQRLFNQASSGTDSISKRDFVGDFEKQVNRFVDFVQNHDKPARPDTDPFFAMLNKNGDEYVTQEEFVGWLHSIPEDPNTDSNIKELKEQAMALFEEAPSLMRQYHLTEPGQPNGSLNFQQYQLYLQAKGILPGGDDTNVA